MIGWFDNRAPSHRKWVALSNDAVALMWRAILWSRSPEAHARPGFLTEKELRALCGGLATRRFKAVVAELLEAGMPAHSVGLLERVEGGYEIHDFEEHGPRVFDVVEAAPESTPTSGTFTLTGQTEPGNTVPSLSSKRSEAGRRGGRKSAEARQAKYGSNQPVGSKQKPEAPEASASGFASSASGASGASANAAVRASRSFSSDLSKDDDDLPSSPGSTRAASSSSFEANEANSTDGDQETVMSLKFALPESAVDELSKHFKQTPEVIREAVTQFRDYWAVGPGTGKRRRHWAAKCRGDIQTKHINGELAKIAERLGKAPGAPASAVPGRNDLTDEQLAKRKAELAAEKEEARRKNRERMQREQQEQSA